MSAFYNENDPDAAQWLRNLMDEGLIPDGTIDTRSVADLEPGDLDGFAQVHLFAGIGGWAHALDLAGWPRDRAVWTGSCPCQPFSTAGKRRGTDDERHLWPAMRDLIAERRPPVVFGEQVASKDGRAWLAGVRDDLEALGYAVGAADLCAAGVGAPHIRQRLFWLADAGSGGREWIKERDGGAQRRGEVQQRRDAFGSGVHGLADAAGQRPGGGRENRAGEQAGVSGTGSEPDDGGGLGDTNSWSGDERNGAQQSRHGATDHWADARLVACGDGFARRVESGAFSLAHGLPRSLGPGSTRQQRVDLRTAKRNRRIRLKGYGNAIVPQLAAEFIAAFMESRAHPPVARDK